MANPFQNLLARTLKPLNIIVSNGNTSVTAHGTMQTPDKLTEQTALALAMSVEEIKFPIDFHADRISKLRFYIADKKGNEIENTELSRFVTNDINPLGSFSDLVYQYFMSYLADGNAYIYATIPSSYKTLSIGSVSRVDILDPQAVELREFAHVSRLRCSSLADMVSEARHYNPSGGWEMLNMQGLTVNPISLDLRGTSSVLAKSPLFGCRKSIDGLLAVYSARYNQYVNNGAAGYLVKEGNNTNTDELAAIAKGATTRDEILKDINSRSGLTGNRNFWGISSIPLKFVKTIASIRELDPLPETLENAIKISAEFKIPAMLVPRSDKITFSSGKDILECEKSVWENATVSLANTFCENYAKAVGLTKAGYTVKADFSSVSALSYGKIEEETLISTKIENLNKMRESFLTSGLDTKKIDSALMALAIDYIK